MISNKTKIAVSRTKFEKSAYYFVALFVLVFLGFWTTYFSKLFDVNGTIPSYFHLHAAVMLIWVVLLIVQPMLIRKKKTNLHRTIGKVSYVVMPLLLFSVLLIINNSLKVLPVEKQHFTSIIFPFRDLFLLTTAFSLAIVYRNNIQIHARAMIITGIIFIEPTLFRFLIHIAFKGNLLLSLVVSIAVVLGILITLMVMERKQKTARWMFPVLLFIYIFVYTIYITKTDLSSLDPIARWIARLPLT
ncbi:MAG: hypothetical protein NVV59_00375 [Chitinophagaceae bacterium]|nr:hypothetical protein [Chitinophagaceae bacterium]